MENPFESRRFGEPTQVLYSQHNHLTTRHLRHRVQTAVEMLIIDELGFVPLSKTGAELLFEVFSRRYERSATLVTSNRLCGAPHKRFNAESIFMRTPRLLAGARRHFAVLLLRILGAAFNISISLSVALKRPVRSFGAITDSRASSFTDGSARV